MSTQTNITKYKEVWRDGEGHFVEAPKPPKTEEPKPQTPEAVPAFILLGAAAIVVAVTFWQVTLTILFAAVAVYAVRWSMSRERIVINHWEKNLV